ncbi:DNRLRE domain-containing protein [Methanolobus sp.]|uniref:DNRLRE domain-containing protein n=1 Tax=Methanolobus sp. TaxID=1874737 RepID=UPI0025850A38|nr:DNRLRE domain-containing protein [Methanolobus sp.]
MINVASCGEVTLLPVKDTYIDDNNPDTNYGRMDYMYSHSSTSQTRYAYLTFYVPDDIEGATISMFVSDGYGSSNISLARISPDWEEDEVTWDYGRPTKEKWQDYTVATASYQKGQWVTWDVSSIIDDPGYYSFQTRSSHGQWHLFNSSESNFNQPYMTVVTAAKSTDYNNIVYNDKTNDNSHSFIVDDGDNIQFSFNPKDIGNVTTYNWYVNKVRQSTVSNELIFTVPTGDVSNPSSCIWEIRAEAVYSNNTITVAEWLLSSLTEDQAPDFIDYFIDQDNIWRTGYITDPWGRPFSSYDQNENYISEGYYSGSSTSTGKVLSTKFNITDGTFRFKIRNPGVQTIAYFKVTGEPESSYRQPSELYSPSWRMEWTANEFHDYFSILSNRIGFGDPYDEDGRFNGVSYIPVSRRWLGQAPGVHWWKNDGNDWRDITIIKTEDGWYSVWENGAMLPHVYGNFEGAFNNATELTLAANGILEMDCIEVYSNQYIYPTTTIEYGTYPKWWRIGEVTYGRLDPVDEEGIKVFGKGVTLKAISEAIDDSTLITYDSSTNTAVLKTNLSLADGSELVIRDETLIIDTSSQPLSINPKVGTSIEIIDSTLTATNYPLVWNFASSVSINVFDPDNTRNIADTTGTSRNEPTYDFRGHFIVKNSVIDNTCNLFLDAPYEVIMSDVTFSNHSNSDYGDYTLRDRYESYNKKTRQSYGDKGLWIVPRIDLTDFVVENIRFVNPKDDISLKVIGGEWIQNSTTLKDSDLSEVSISVMKALKYEYYQDYWVDDEASTLALLNTLYDEDRISVAGHEMADGSLEYDSAALLTKYYLDIKVVDSSYQPLPGSLLTMDSSNNMYPAENLYNYRDFITDAYGPGAGGVSGYGSENLHNETYTGGVYTRWYNALALGSATTDSNGHTSLPTSTDLENSIVLTDFVLTSDGGVEDREYISYDLNVNIAGTGISLDSISPDSSWYREDPGVSAYTITAVIPDDDSTLSITGFAPSSDNTFQIGQTKTFKVWTNEELVSTKWFVDGIQVSTGSMEYDWAAVEGSHLITFTGSSATETVVQTWDLSVTEGTSEEAPVSSGTGLSFTPSASSLTATTGESTTFSVETTQEFTSAVWSLDGVEVESGTTDHVETWTTAGTHTVTFDGTAAAGTISRSWVVIVSTAEYSTITISPSTTTVAPGESFSLDVYIDPTQALTGSQFDLQYSQLASISTVDEGDLFTTGDLATTFQYDSIDNAAGLLDNVYTAIVGSGTISSPGVMATIEMVAGSSSGILDLGLSDVILSDANSNPAGYTVSNATVLIDTAPQFTSVSAQTVEEKQSLSFTVTANDADGDDLSYSSTSLPSGATFNDGSFSWTPSQGDAGSYVATFEVTDGYLTDTVSVSITVTPLNNLPEITLFEPADGSTFEEGSIIGVNVAATDADGDSLSYIIEIDGVQVSTATSYTWTTDYESAGTHTIKVTVSDGTDEVSSSGTITITDVQPRWDVNEDGTVNVLDITLVGQNYGQTYTENLPRWDVNQDGTVNIQDLSIVSGHFGETI